LLRDRPTFDFARLENENESWGLMPSRYARSLRILPYLGGLTLAIVPALAAEVTADRLVNADKEPGNWLMNHRTYDAQRYSPLDQINKANVSNLRLAYAVAIGGSSVNENLEATPLAEDGFLYVVDQLGVLYKIDGRSGEIGRIIWRMDPGQEKVPLSNRGAALWGNLVVTVANYPPRMIATDKQTGRVVWQSNLSDGQVDVQLTAAPIVVRDKIFLGAAGGDRGVRDFIVAVDAATGKIAWRKYVIPAPGEPGSDTWKDHHNAWQTGGGAMWVTGSYDVAANQVLWGTGNPVPSFDPYYRPGDNLYTNSLISWDSDHGKMNWYFQYTPGDMWNFDEAGTHILIDATRAGKTTKMIAHVGRNGFLYTMNRADGQLLFAKPYMTNVNWTNGIDQETGKPLDYDTKKDVQVYSGQISAKRARKLCPSLSGGNNFWPASYSRRTGLLYVATSMSSCVDVAPDVKLATVAGDWKGGFRDVARIESEVVAVDPLSGELRRKRHSIYQDNSGVVSTAGGIIFTGYTNGTFAAFDDSTLEELWKINVGIGFAAPPMTFEANGRQYVAILAGLSRAARIRNNLAPELRDMRNQTMLFVFGL
jgi:alcohol dehydrogenase (cytochrome c)